VRGLLAPLVKLSLFLVITIAATYVLAATISNSTYGKTTTYRAQFTDATGLNLGDDVRIAGVRVGAVTGVKVVNHNTAEVKFSVRADRRLPRSVQITIRYRNLVGQRYLAVDPGTGDANVFWNPRQPIDESHTVEALDLTTLFGGFTQLFAGLDATQINQLSEEIIQILQGEGGSLDLLLQQTADLTNSLADKDKVIGDLIDNLNSVLATVGDRDQQLKELINSLQQFVSGLSDERVELGNSIEGVSQLATVTTQLLVKVRPPLAKDVKDVKGAVQSLNDNKATVAGVIQRLPGKVAALTRTASYGSWFNFYLCAASGTVNLPGNVKVPTQLALPFNGDSSRCS